jgi:hypothetical protein
MVRLSLTFGELGGNLWARRVYTWKFPDFSGHVYSIAGTSQSATRYACILGSMQLDESRTPSMNIGTRSSSKSEVTGVQGHSQDR